MLLPSLELQTVFHALNFDIPDGSAPGNAANSTGERVKISSFLCPSDTDRLTNVASGKSIVVKISGPGTFTFHADGSLSADEKGANLVVFFPTDIPAGPHTYVFTGHTILAFDAFGNETLVSTTDQHPFDVCAALS
jgi:hypothetical protein